jgi:hypothetical protein
VMIAMSIDMLCRVMGKKLRSFDSTAQLPTVASLKVADALHVIPFCLKVSYTCLFVRPTVRERLEDGMLMQIVVQVRAVIY